MDIENSMVVGAQDVYDGCGLAHDRSSSLDEAREYFSSSRDGVAELHELMLDSGNYFLILENLLVMMGSGSDTKKAIYLMKSINIVEISIEHLAAKKLNGVHQ